MPLLNLIIYWIFILPYVFLKIFLSDPKMIVTLFHLGVFDFFTQFRALIFGVSDITALYWSRYIAAVVGTGAVVMVYSTTKKLFNKSAGLFAAFFLAFNFRHVLGSHFGLPDIYSSFFNTLALYGAVLLLEKNTRKRYIIAGITAALALSIKYQPFAYLPFFMVHFLWVFKKKSFWYLFNKDFILGTLSSIATFIVINPYYLFNIKEAMSQVSIDYIWYQMGIYAFRFYSYFYLYHFGIGAFPSIAILLGIVIMSFNNFKKNLLLLSFIVPFFFIITIYSNAGSYTRNFVSVIPLLMIYAGFSMDILYGSLKKINKSMGGIIIVIILILINSSSIKNSVVLDYNYAKPWNIDSLTNWLRENIPSNITIAPYQIPFAYQEQMMLKSKNIKRLDWNYAGGPNSLAEFQEEGMQFAILNTEAFQLATYRWRGWNDYKEYFKYNNVPFDYIQSSFYGLAMKELMQYTVYEVYKPWQAQGERNYLVFKIPEKPTEIGKKIAYFGFDIGKDMWRIRSSFGFETIKGGWADQEGNSSKGALVITKGGGIPTSRLSSPAVPIKRGMVYTVRGFIKNDPGIRDADNEGFLRIDFYKNNSEAEIDGLGISVALSKRASVSGGWEEVKASIRAPADAKYLTISFQRKEPVIFGTRSFKKSQELKFSSYLDDVELFESFIQPDEAFSEFPYIKPTIPMESIYSNSFL
jgi:hypothetical protein